jgi:hypothetical protein
LVDKVSGSGWGVHGDSSVTIYECATAYYAVATCDGSHPVSTVLGTGTKAGRFAGALLTLDTGTMDTNGDTCGLATSGPCYLMAVGNSGDQTPTVALSFTVPTLTAKNTVSVLGNHADGLNARSFPVGDTVMAEECDAAVSVPATIATHCDSATQITGTVAGNGKVAFATGLTLREGGAYSDLAAGTCEPGGACEIVVQDEANPAIAVAVSVSFATPTATAKVTAAVVAN